MRIVVCKLCGMKFDKEIPRHGRSKSGDLRKVEWCPGNGSVIKRQGSKVTGKRKQFSKF